MDRRIIAKVGHINRELNTNNRFSEKSVERLSKIFLAHSKDGEFSGQDDFFDVILNRIKETKNLDKLNDEQRFWVEELMEWTRYGIINVGDPEEF